MKKQQNKTWIKKEYEQNTQFHRQMQLAQERYKQTVQISIYSNLQQVSKLKVIEKIGEDSDHNEIFAIYGMLMPLEGKLLEKTHFLIVNFLDELITNMKNCYTLIFFNTLCPTYENFAHFQNILKSMPFKYFQKLNKIILVHSNFGIKAYQFFQFSTMNKIIAHSLVYIDHISELTSYKINPKQISVKLPKQILSVDNPIQEPNSHKGKSSSTIAPFILKIEKNEIIGIKLQDYQPCEEGFPMVIKILFLYFEIKPQKTKQEGIFRKNGDIQQQKQLEKRMILKDYDYLSQVDDPYIVCGLIKKIFNNMQQPLFPYHLYTQILDYKHNQNPQDQFIIYLLQKLDQLNFITLQFTLSYLVQKIIIYQNDNKMSAYNMAVVFSPCFFRPKEYKIDDLVHSIKFTKFLHKIFQRFTIFFGSKLQQEEVYRKSQEKSVQLYSKKVLSNARERIVKEKEALMQSNHTKQLSN